MDTLDNVGFQKTRRNQLGFNFGLGFENAQRIQRQNEREISVIIGNPPYNAKQKNENDNNKNRKYPDVDRRIKDTYLSVNKSQKTAIYDPYVRFIRWATDRLADKGILCFITNSSFIHKDNFRGFRKVVADEFSDIYLVDLGGDVRANPKLSGTKHNVFGIQAGVAIAFFVKQPQRKGQQARIHYASRPPIEVATDKLTFLHETKFKNVDFDRIKPDAKGNWLGQTDNDWKNLIPLVSKVTKATKNMAGEDALFKQFAPGYMSGRDEWVVDFNNAQLTEKAKLFAKVYHEHTSGSKEFDTEIKWSETLKSKLASGDKMIHVEEQKIRTLYRPYVSSFLHNSEILIDRIGAFNMFGIGPAYIGFSGIGSSKPFQTLASVSMMSYDCLEKTQCIPVHYYNKNGDKQPNITAWGLAQFRKHYGAASISGEDIFHYAYAVLYDPHYRAAYAQNLKQDFPRLPFYPDFGAWATAGRQLLALHLNYEKIQLLPGLGTYTPAPPHPRRARGQNPPQSRRRGRHYFLQRGGIAQRYSDRCLALPPRQPLGLGMGARPVQGAHAQGPHHPRPLRHIPLRRPRRGRGRPTGPRLHRQRRNYANRGCASRPVAPAAGGLSE
ncbi:type ISP restriction/modification enzyme [Hymenobacter sp. PAMC 26628]|uniref:type ISP restriction/modification enzyme n=1 Tax=Hymenobacter sp. PAMC 26628 TaxID=1484118 RepID=UPI0019509D03|nr:type ISP restriction/modification enzyme [Hymenobacter sp. PAMC 26628]